MIINIDLLLNSPEIIKGLMTGELTRYGSVIRWAKGTAKAGQIVKHLVETPGITSKLISLPLSPISTVVNIIGHGITYHKLLGIERSISAVMGLTQIAAGASVLNLGVSVAGFTYMGYKLHQVQKSLGYLQQSMEAGFERVEADLEQLDRKVDEGFSVVIQGLNHLDNRLTVVSGQLAYLYVLVEDSRQKQESLAKAISNLQKAMLVEKIADLQAELKDRQLFPNDSPRQALKTASSVRLFLENQATQATPELDAELMLNTDVAIQGWAIATATEANLLLEMGHHQDAIALLSQTVPSFQEVAQMWATNLIHHDNAHLSTSYRYNAPYFQDYITPERVDRITQISPRDRTLTPDQIRRKRNEAEVEFEMSYSSQRYPETWQHQQIAVAEYLDTLSELSARLNSLQDFAQLCESTGVSSSKDLLPDSDTPGLYLLSPVNG